MNSKVNEMQEPTPTPSNERPEALARAVQEGDARGAIALAARLHGPALTRLSMALLGDVEEASACAAEALAAAHDALPGLGGEGAHRAFFFGFARKACARRLETRGRRATEASDGASGAHRRALAVRSALAALKPSERDAVALRYVAGLDLDEVAAACGVDVTTARTRVSRGLARMTERLAGTDSHGEVAR